jgi:hypothetical protein
MSSSFVCYCIEHNILGYCCFLEQNSIKFVKHPVRGTCYDSFADCHKKLLDIKSNVFYDREKRAIDTGMFSIVEIAVGAYSRPTKYSARPFYNKDKKI